MICSTIKIIFGTFFIAMLCGACQSEGHRYVDEMAATLEEGARMLATARSQDEASAVALEYFQERSVEMRIVQSRFDDTVRTLNRYQRAELAEYAKRRLAAVQQILAGLSEQQH